MALEEAALLSDRWPRLSEELVTALHEEGEDVLAELVANLRVLELCDCGDSFCQSFYTQPPPDGTYGPGHRNIGLSPEKPGMLILDVVDNSIMFVEVIDRPPLN